MQIVSYLWTGLTELQNLKFVGEFMEVKGLSTTMIAEKLGISRQSVYYWLKKDDAMMSNIYAIFETYGLKIRFDLVEEGVQESPMKIPGVGLATKKPRIGFFSPTSRGWASSVSRLRRCSV